MSIVSQERLREALSSTLEQRSKGYADLVSNNNALMYFLKQKKRQKAFSGPTIRERLQIEDSGQYTRYSGYQILDVRPNDIFEDAEFLVKQAAVTVTLSGREIKLNSGKNQLIDILKEKIEGAERNLMDRFYEDMHSDGTADGGLQIDGLGAMIPVVADAGVYGGIDRAQHAIWRTRTIDASDDEFGYGATIEAGNIRKYLTRAIIDTTAGRRGVDVALMSPDHYIKLEEATQAIQRITDENGIGNAGFQALKYSGGGRTIDVVNEGGYGSVMPADTTYLLGLDDICWRYHPDRNFAKDGEAQRPVNQDAIVDTIYMMGNMTLRNPRHQVRLIG